MRVGAIHRSGDGGDKVRRAGGVEITVERVQIVARGLRPAPLANDTDDRQEHLARVAGGGAVEGGLEDEAIAHARKVRVVAREFRMPLVRQYVPYDLCATGGVHRGEERARGILLRFLGGE